MKLRIATYNIHKGVSAFGRKTRIHELREAIKTLDADIVFLQEVQGQHDHHAAKHTSWPEQAQHEFLAGDTHQSVYGMNAIYEHGHHGNALLSKHPIKAWQNRDVSDHAYEQRGILHVVVEIEKWEVHCFVVHLGLFAASRRRQIQSLIQQVQQHVPAKSPLIIAGDFNDWSQRLSHTLYKELNVIEAFDHAAESNHDESRIKAGLRQALKPLAPHQHARTFPAGLPCLSLDRIYLRGFKLENATIMRGEPWKHLSDHIPLIVELSLNHFELLA